MAHHQQKEFMDKVKSIFPSNFKNVTVIDCGSLDVNGSFKDLFEDSVYIGVDIVNGGNVDIVSKTHELDFSDKFNTVVSGEMLEHDEFWEKSLKKMYDMCVSGGLIAITCAGKNRPEHGTLRTGSVWGTSEDYYKNLTPEDFKTVFKDEMFSDVHYEEHENPSDTYFYGIKK